MPVSYTLNVKNGFIITEYTGTLTFNELIKARKALYDIEDWKPGLHELADLSGVGPNKLTIGEIQLFADFVNSLVARHNTGTSRIGIYAPEDHQFALAKMYELLSNSSTYELAIFSTLTETEEWLANGRLTRTQTIL